MMLAEHATFALAHHMPRARAQDIVRRAAARARATDRHMIDVLRDLTPASLDWDGLRDAHPVGMASMLVERVLATVRQRSCDRRTTS